MHVYMRTCTESSWLGDTFVDHVLTAALKRGQVQQLCTPLSGRQTSAFPTQQQNDQ